LQDEASAQLNQNKSQQAQQASQLTLQDSMLWARE